VLGNWQSLEIECLHDDCVTLEFELKYSDILKIFGSYTKSVKDLLSSLYNYLEYQGLMHEEHDCLPLIKAYSSLDTPHTDRYTVYCCGRKEMTRRQQVNRERFFSENQKRKPTLITIEGGEFLEIDTPYNTEFISLFKARIPPRDRYWDPKSKRWGIRASLRAQAVDIIHTIYGKVEEATEPMSLTGQITRDSEKLVNDAIAKAKGRLIRERGAGSIVI